MRALDTTRIFGLRTETSFADENDLLERCPAKFTLNRLRGGNDAIHLAGFLGVSSVMRSRDFEVSTDDED